MAEPILSAPLGTSGSMSHRKDVHEGPLHFWVGLSALRRRKKSLGPEPSLVPGPAQHSFLQPKAARRPGNEASQVLGLQSTTGNLGNTNS